MTVKPKIDLNRETNRKKEKEDIEDINRVLNGQRSGRDDAKYQFENFRRKKEEYEAQIKQQGDQLSFYRRDNKEELENYIRNEEALIEYKTLTYKQSAKIKELKEEIDNLNKKFPLEVSKHTKEIEFMKADNENKRSELEFKYQGRLLIDRRFV